MIIKAISRLIGIFGTVDLSEYVLIISMLIISSISLWAKISGYRQPGDAAPAVRQSRATKKFEGDDMEIGLIGVGMMGQPMAKRLIAAGHSLIIYDTRNDAVAPLVAPVAVDAAVPAPAAPPAMWSPAPVA